jgi:hypothetical protein
MCDAFLSMLSDDFSYSYLRFWMIDGSCYDDEHPPPTPASASQCDKGKASHVGDAAVEMSSPGKAPSPAGPSSLVAGRGSEAVASSGLLGEERYGGEERGARATEEEGAAPLRRLSVTAAAAACCPAAGSVAPRRLSSSPFRGSSSSTAPPLHSPHLQLRAPPPRSGQRRPPPTPVLHEEP